MGCGDRIVQAFQIGISWNMIQVNLRNIFGLILLIFTVNAMATAEPKFDLLEKSDNYELRQYYPMIIAEVLVDGDMEQASGKGFRLYGFLIFRYWNKLFTE